MIAIPATAETHDAVEGRSDGSINLVVAGSNRRTEPGRNIAIPEADYRSTNDAVREATPARVNDRDLLGRGEQHRQAIRNHDRERAIVFGGIGSIGHRRRLWTRPLTGDVEFVAVYLLEPDGLLGVNSP
ncbi:MAG: hypothetical protein U5O39_04385 [Gammaproteobacteria bacterium]|nr:hypothetical protein [Gammaproteobacteria bacterium]